MFQMLSFSLDTWRGRDTPHTRVYVAGGRRDRPQAGWGAGLGKGTSPL